MRSRRGLLYLAALVAAGMAAGLVGIFFWVPTEEFQGPVQRIFYVHVPAAWIAYLAFAVVLIGSIQYLRIQSPSWDRLAASSAEVGVLFCALNIGTGMLWAKPIWGTYWTWDARLTSMFVLFLIYLGYVLFRATATEPGGGGRIAAVIGIVGFTLVPFVHFSVQWFRTLHPEPTVIRPRGGPQLPAEMLLTLLFMVGIFTLLYALMLALRIRQARVEEEITALEAA